MLTSDYTRCPHCRLIIFDPSSKLAKMSHPTPCCGRSGEARIIWPSPETLKFLEIVASQNLEAPDDFRIAVVFLSTALELLLEDSLREQLRRHVKTSELSEYLLRTVRGRDDRLRLYAAPHGGKFRDVMSKAGKAAFLDLWDKLAAARNEIAHGRCVVGDKIAKDELNHVAQGCLSAFAALQNFSSTGRPLVPTA